jgi:hypothetical protein
MYLRELGAPYVRYLVHATAAVVTYTQPLLDVPRFCPTAPIAYQPTVVPRKPPMVHASQ